MAEPQKERGHPLRLSDRKGSTPVINIDEVNETRKPAHTPGPWSVWTSCSWRRVGSDAWDGGGLVCEPIVQNDGHPDLHFRNGGEDGPDARLISASPDLLEALQGLMRDLIDEGEAPLWEACYNPLELPCVITARAAIAKALGQ